MSHEPGPADDSGLANDAGPHAPRAEPIDLNGLRDSEAQLSELLTMIDAEELLATKAQRAYLAGARDALAMVGGQQARELS